MTSHTAKGTPGSEVGLSARDRMDRLESELPGPSEGLERVGDAGREAKCGKNTKILRYANGHVTTIWAAPDGTELGGLQVDDVNGAPVIALGELDCARQDWGAYKIGL